MDFASRFRYADELTAKQCENGRLRIACQTNAWPIEPGKPETLFAALDAIRRLEFGGFETGFRNVISLGQGSSQFREHAAQLTFFGVHIFLHEYDPKTHVAPLDLAMDVAETGAALGAQQLILSGAPAPINERVQKIEGLNEIANRVAPLGLKLAYHNHRAEFEGTDPEIDALVSGTDAERVLFVLDAGHIFRARLDISSFVTRHASRLSGIHLRDFKAERQTPLGSGDFPLEEVAETIRRINWSGWVLAEEEREDGSKPGLAAVEPARQALRQAFGL